MPDAEISASTAPEKVEKTRSDGSYSLQVEEHTGTFTLTVKKTGYAPVTISIDAEKSNHTVPVIQLTKVYTTTVKGKVITPAKAADRTKGRIITTARVWSSIDPTKKIDVGADSSYSLQVASHTGNFTITAEYTTTVSGKLITPARAADPARGSTITTARVWSNIDPAKKVEVGADGSYSLQVVSHSGSFTITPDGRLLIVSSRGPNNPHEGYLVRGCEYGRIFFINLKSGTLDEWIWGRDQPTGLAVDPSGRYLAFTNLLSDSLELYRLF